MVALMVEGGCGCVVVVVVVCGSLWWWCWWWRGEEEVGRERVWCKSGSRNEVEIGDRMPATAGVSQRTRLQSTSSNCSPIDVAVFEICPESTDLGTQEERFQTSTSISQSALGSGELLLRFPKEKWQAIRAGGPASALLAPGTSQIMVPFSHPIHGEWVCIETKFMRVQNLCPT